MIFGELDMDVFRDLLLGMMEDVTAKSCVMGVPNKSLYVPWSDRSFIRRPPLLADGCAMDIEVYPFRDDVRPYERSLDSQVIVSGIETFLMWDSYCFSAVRVTDVSMIPVEIRRETVKWLMHERRSYARF